VEGCPHHSSLAGLIYNLKNPIFDKLI